MGLGNSHEKFQYLFASESDFIFAVIGEELGLVGALFVIGLFFCVLYAGLAIAERASDDIGAMIAGGATVMLVFQAFLNIACVIGVFPTTGKPLPFISSGGTSMIASFILVGLVLSVSAAPAAPSVYEQRRADLRLVRREPAPPAPSGRTRSGESLRSRSAGASGRSGSGRIDVRPDPALRAHLTVPITGGKLMLAVLSGGGTAGHINPALALADELVSRGWDVRFAGTPGGVESRLVPAAGIPFTAFEASGFDRSHPASLAKGVAKIAASTGKAKKWFADIKPDVVVGFGGYVCIPVARAAEKTGVPVVLHEQNSVAGMANKYLARRADAVCVTYECSAESLGAAARSP